MPGPIFAVASESFDAFHSCEDVQEAWGGCNGISKQETHNTDHDSQQYKLNYNKTHHLNGLTNATMDMSITGTTSDTTEEEHKNDLEVTEKDATPDRNMTCLEECREDMEMDDDDPVTDAVNIPVVEARLSVDINKALTRQKIYSLQMGRTLSYADKEDSEEPPTRRTRPFAQHRDSMEVGELMHKPFSEDSSTSHPPKTERNTASLPPKTERNIKVSRNPSYHSAVRESIVDSPHINTKKVESPLVNTKKLQSQLMNTKKVESPLVNTKKVESLLANNPHQNAKIGILNLQDSGTSSEGSPEHEPIYSSSVSMDAISAARNSSIRSQLPQLEKNIPLDLHVAANMPRSASFSGGGLLSPSQPANGSLSVAYGRRGSISQPATPVTKRSKPQVTIPKETLTINDNIPARGSAISRSFRRLFSAPTKSSQAPATPPEELYWSDLEQPSTPTSLDPRPTSRLRKLSTTLTRKLSTRAPTKMSSSFTFPTGTNGHQQMTTNGETIPDTNALVDYEELMKLFCCSGCQSIMVPPLHQCRKGHLVCNTCRFSLKQVCPVCKQRFAETTNLMMEQVCQLVKFPCKWSNSGCQEFHPPRSRSDHEHFCVYRPLHCHNASNGCKKVLLMRDMHQHLDECQFKDK